MAVALALALVVQEVPTDGSALAHGGYSLVPFLNGLKGNLIRVRGAENNQDALH